MEIQSQSSEKKKKKKKKEKKKKEKEAGNLLVINELVFLHRMMTGW